MCFGKLLAIVFANPQPAAGLSADSLRLGLTNLTETGMLEGVTIGSYLMLVDATSRMVRSGKARVDKDVCGIFDRLGTTNEAWLARIQQLVGRVRPFGSFLRGTRDRLRDLAGKLGMRRVVNHNGCETSS